MRAWLVICIDTGCGKCKRLTSRHSATVSNRENDAINSANKATCQQEGPTLPFTGTPLTPVTLFVAA